MSRVASQFLVVAMATFLATGWLTARPQPVRAVSPNVVISQVYGGGGQHPARRYRHDFIELFNRGTSSQSLDIGWTVQYASATGDAASSAPTTTSRRPTSVGRSARRAVPIPRPGGLARARSAHRFRRRTSPIATAGITMAGWRRQGHRREQLDRVTCAATAARPPCTRRSSRTIVRPRRLRQRATSLKAPDRRDAAQQPALCIRERPTGCTDTGTTSRHRGCDVTARHRHSLTPLEPADSTLSINDVSQNEGPTGSRLMRLHGEPVRRRPGAGGVTFDIATADGSRRPTADNDYIAQVADRPVDPVGQHHLPVLASSSTATRPSRLTRPSSSTSRTSPAPRSPTDRASGTLVNDDVASIPATTRSRRSTRSRAAGASAAITGNVTTEGVVVGDFEGAAAGSGLLHPGPDRRRRPATSDGIFVFTGSARTLVNRRRRPRHRLRPRALQPDHAERLEQQHGRRAGSEHPRLRHGHSVPRPMSTLPFASRDLPRAVRGHARQLPAGARDRRVLQLRPLRRDRPRTTPRRRDPAVHRTAIDEPGVGRQPMHADCREPACGGSPSTTTRARRTRRSCAIRTATRSRSRTSSGAATSSQNAVGVLGFDFSLYRILPTGPADYTP